MSLSVLVLRDVQPLDSRSGWQKQPVFVIQAVHGGNTMQIFPPQRMCLRTEVFLQTRRRISWVCKLAHIDRDQQHVLCVYTAGIVVVAVFNVVLALRTVLCQSISSLYIVQATCGCFVFLLPNVYGLWLTECSCIVQCVLSELWSTEQQTNIVTLCCNTIKVYYKERHGCNNICKRVCHLLHTHTHTTSLVC